MWTRFKTAIILVMIVGVALFASDIPYLILPLLGFGVIIAAYEWTKLMPKYLQPVVYVLGIFFTTMLTLGLPSLWPQAALLWPLWWTAAAVVWLMALAWVIKYPLVTGWYGKRLALLGLVILTAAITAMFYLWQHSPWWLLYVFVLVWCADTGAYLVGRKLGKHKMSPMVSPNKSIEGLAGGLATGLVMVMLISVFKLHLSGVTLLAFTLLSGITILVSVLGDLFESMLKRQAGVKDSGNILPGHGGILDRIDSLLAAVPIFALGFWGLQQLGMSVLA